jgi:hypothetical protein
MLKGLLKQGSIKPFQDQMWTSEHIRLEIALNNPDHKKHVTPLLENKVAPLASDAYGAWPVLILLFQKLDIH